MPCIGEQLKEREANKTDEVCFNQMKAIAGTEFYFDMLEFNVFIFALLGRLRRVDLITWVRCPSVRPQKVFPIPMKFGMQVEVE